MKDFFLVEYQRGECEAECRLIAQRLEMAIKKLSRQEMLRILIGRGVYLAPVRQAPADDFFAFFAADLILTRQTA